MEVAHLAAGAAQAKGAPVIDTQAFAFKLARSVQHLTLKPLNAESIPPKARTY